MPGNHQSNRDRYTSNILLVIISFEEKTTIIRWIENRLCIPESFDMNISHQLFDYKIQHENINSKGDFVFKNRFEMSKKISDTQR